MKNGNKNLTQPLRPLAATIGLFLLGLTTACAPPPATDAGLQNELAVMKQQQQQQQQVLLAIQQQLAELQQRIETPAPAETTAQLPLQTEPLVVAPVTEPVAAQAPVPVTGIEEMQALVAAAGSYLESFSALAMGYYDQAQSGFEAFLQNHTEHRYAPSARYWLAETQIALGLQEQAEENLLIIANANDSAEKAPEALSRLVQLYRQQNQTIKADDILHQLRTRFPESREAQHFNRSDQTQ